VRKAGKSVRIYISASHCHRMKMCLALASYDNYILEHCEHLQHLTSTNNSICFLWKLSTKVLFLWNTIYII